MKKHWNLYACIVLALAMALGMSTAVTFAADRVAGSVSSVEGIEAASEQTALEQEVTFTTQANDSHIRIKKPKSGYTAYMGEKVEFKFTMDDTYVSYRTKPVVRFMDKKGKTSYKTIETKELVPVDGSESYTGYFKVKGVDTGTYKIVIYCAACDEKGKLVAGWESFTHSASVKVSLKMLFWPETIRVKSQNGKVSVNFSKSPGATKYEVFRSTREKSGYKKIATVKDRKYVDKKVKHKKTYYYKVRAVRDKHGTIRSDYGAIAEVYVY